MAIPLRGFRSRVSGTAILLYSLRLSVQFAFRSVAKLIDQRLDSLSWAQRHLIAIVEHVWEELCLSPEACLLVFYLITICRTRRSAKRDSSGVRAQEANSYYLSWNKRRRLLWLVSPFSWEGWIISERWDWRPLYGLDHVSGLRLGEDSSPRRPFPFLEERKGTTLDSSSLFREIG